MRNYLLLLIFIIASPASVCSQKPATYPGSIEERPGSNRYLTKDSYEKVKEYYVRIYGDPDYETEHNATFFYEDVIHEPRGIHINDGNPDSKGVKQVLSQLKLLVERGDLEGRVILSEARYKEIENEYRHLQDYFYAYEEDASGRYIREDEAIFKKYNKKSGHGGTEAHNNEELMKQAQDLIMAGKIEEGTALMKQIKNTMAKDMEHAGSPGAVDSWINCLEEINACKYGVTIRLDR